jgi:hypothetical protein
MARGLMPLPGSTCSVFGADRTWHTGAPLVVIGAGKRLYLLAGIFVATLLTQSNIPRHVPPDTLPCGERGLHLERHLAEVHGRAFDALGRLIERSIAEWHGAQPPGTPSPEVESVGDFIVAELNRRKLRCFDGLVARVEEDADPNTHATASVWGWGGTLPGAVAKGTGDLRYLGEWRGKPPGRRPIRKRRLAGCGKTSREHVTPEMF